MNRSLVGLGAAVCAALASAALPGLLRLRLRLVRLCRSDREGRVAWRDRDWLLPCLSSLRVFDLLLLLVADLLLLRVTDLLPLLLLRLFERLLERERDLCLRFLEVDLLFLLLDLLLRLLEERDLWRERDLRFT